MRYAGKAAPSTDAAFLVAAAKRLTAVMFSMRFSMLVKARSRYISQSSKPASPLSAIPKAILRLPAPH